MRLLQDEALMGGGALMDDDDRFANLQSLQLRSPKGHDFAFPSLASLSEAGASIQTAYSPIQSIVDPSDHLTPGQLSNQVHHTHNYHCFNNNRVVAEERFQEQSLTLKNHSVNEV